MNNGEMAASKHTWLKEGSKSTSTLPGKSGPSHGPGPSGHSKLMFPFITAKWNPVTGCRHNCVYCWAKLLAETRLKNLPRYAEGFVPSFHPEELKRKFKEDDCQYGTGKTF